MVEDSGDLVLLAVFLAQLSFVELYAEGVTPGVLERALELEQLVGPLPTQTMTPTLVEGLRLMYATSTRPAREALAARARRRRGSRRRAPNRQLSSSCSTVLECRAGEWSRADEYAEELLEDGEQRGLDFRASGAVDPRPGRCLSRPPRPSSRAGDRRTLALARGRLYELPRAEPCPARPDRPVHRRLPQQRRSSWLRSSAGARHAAGGAEPLPGPGARDRGAGRGRRPRRGPRPARMAGGSRPPARRLPGPWRWARAAGACCRRPRATSKRHSQAASRRSRCTSGCLRRSSAPAPCSSTARSFAATKRRKAAREAIEAALSIFEALPAPVWADNARAELARIGGRAASGDGLTEGERRIAELVAAGKSNKETAAALFLSVHTVEGALKRVYRKLGVRSRTELSRRLSADS